MSEAAKANGGSERVFSAMIREVRISRRLSQYQLASLCGRSQPQIAQWESGACSINEPTVELVAGALGNTVRQFLYAGLRALARVERERIKASREAEEKAP